MKAPEMPIASLLVFLAGVGCGGTMQSQSCNATALSISPPAATANHAATAPANQQQFSAAPVLPTGCTPPPLPLDFATWSVSDPVNVSISNANDSTRGTATCIGATAGPVTVTAMANDTRLAGGATVSGTATLTCN